MEASIVKLKKLLFTKRQPSMKVMQAFLCFDGSSKENKQALITMFHKQNAMFTHQK